MSGVVHGVGCRCEEVYLYQEGTTLLKTMGVANKRVLALSTVCLWTNKNILNFAMSLWVNHTNNKHNIYKNTHLFKLLNLVLKHVLRNGSKTDWGEENYGNLGNKCLFTTRVMMFHVFFLRNIAYNTNTHALTFKISYTFLLKVQ